MNQSMLRTCSLNLLTPLMCKPMRIGGAPSAAPVAPPPHRGGALVSGPGKRRSGGLPASPSSCCSLHTVHHGNDSLIAIFLVELGTEYFVAHPTMYWAQVVSFLFFICL